MSVRDRVRTVVAVSLGIAASEVTPDASIVMDLGADSLGLAEMSVQLEREFRLEIRDQDMARVDTVGDVIRLIEEHESQRASGSFVSAAAAR